MSLSALIKKGGLRSIATATPATFATDEPQQRPSVATVATVAVATAPDKAANDPTQAQGFDREAFEERAAIMEFDGGLSRTESERLALSTDGANLKEPEADDPDRHSWPHTTAMNSAEIDAFNARVQLFIRRGIGGTEAEGLADGLVIRDRDGDDRRLCLECQHLRGGGRSWACNQWRAAGLGAAGVPADMVMLLQRCDGFKGEAASMQHDHKPPERAKGTPEG